MNPVFSLMLFVALFCWQVYELSTNDKNRAWNGFFLCADLVFINKYATILINSAAT